MAKKRRSLKLRMNNRQRQAWDTIYPLLLEALSEDGIPGQKLRMFRTFATMNPEKALAVRARTPWFDQILLMIGE